MRHLPLPTHSAATKPPEMKSKQIGRDPLLHAQPLSLYTHNEQERLRIKRRHLSK